MPLPGGATDKFGNRYEGKWTVAKMAEVLNEGADSIRLEPPGEEGTGVEFWLQKGEACEYHQVKRQHGSDGRWTLRSLNQRNVLETFFAKLSDPRAKCVFVSTHSAYQLEELSDRARRSASWEEFEREFLRDHQHSTDFTCLCQFWGCSKPDAYHRVRRVEVRTLGERDLEDKVRADLRLLIEGDVDSVRDELAQHALAKVHHELNAHDLWSFLLDERGHRRCEWGKDRGILATVDRVNESYLHPLRSQSINEVQIPRNEAEIVFQKLTVLEGKRVVMLTGEAGVGKSGVILQTAEKLRVAGIPFLAFRMDRRQPTEYPDELGRQLDGLPGSPARVLASTAQKRECVLVIDQLDAVSLASGRHSEFFGCFEMIVKEALQYPNMRVLLVCRRFDLENDHRFRRLTGPKGTAEAEIVGVKRLSSDRVLEILSMIGLEHRRLDDKQLQLLSLPLHLSLLTQIATSSSAFDFATVKDLYDSFWSHKQRVIEERIQRPVQWTTIVQSLCAYMSTHQCLSAPASVLKAWERDAEVMVSEHVLMKDEHQYGFFHEGFFDYAYARSFNAEGQSLIPFLLNDEQHLFRRAQVRQILLHERDENYRRYLDDLHALLTDPRIRIHLKQVAFALLASFSDPKVEEWNILNSLICPHTYPASEGDTAVQRGESEQAWNVAVGSAGWFHLLDLLGHIEGWLARPDDEWVDRTLYLLASVQKHASSRIAELIAPYLGASEVWNRRIGVLLGRSDLSQDRALFDLFLKALDDGIFDTQELWQMLHFLREKSPAWTCEAIGHYLQRRLELSLTVGQPNPFDDRTGTIRDAMQDEMIFATAATQAPDVFVHEVLPFMLRVMELTVTRLRYPPYCDAVWTHREFGKSYRIETFLLNAVVTALRSLAKTDPSKYRDVARQLKSSDFETAQHLLLRSLGANPEVFANEAVDDLCNRPQCFDAGYMNGGSHWATREMLVEVTPCCSEDRLRQLEDILLDYYPDWEKKYDARTYRGCSQFTLLDGIDPTRRSPKATRRFQEWQRKFRKNAPTPPSIIMGGVVVSPIPEQSAQRMTDNQWLRAIAQYRDDSLSRRIYRHDHFTGGSTELSRTLEAVSKTNPTRFLALALRFPDDTHPYYFDAVLNGVADAGVDLEMVLPLFHRCHNLPSRPCGRSISQAIKKYAFPEEHPLPSEMLDLVAWYATDDPDPEIDTWQSLAHDGTLMYGGDIDFHGINTVRGSVAQAIGELIFRDGSRLPHFAPILERLAHDPVLSVRSCAATTLLGVLRHNRDMAVRLFLELCDGDDALLASAYVQKFLYYGIQTHFDSLKPILWRMLLSEDMEIATKGAEFASFVAFIVDNARPFLEHCLQNNEDVRKGVAKVLAARVGFPETRCLCENALSMLFDDPDAEVRATASGCFDDIPGEQLGEYKGLIEAFTKSIAFRGHHSKLIHALRETTAKLPDITCFVCECFFDTIRQHALERPRASAYEESIVAELILRVYHHTESDGIRTRCLNTIDQMIELQTDGFDRTLSEYER